MGVFLDASILNQKENDELFKVDVKLNNIRFEFPQGFTKLALIEECRAINALDVSDPDNFDFMFDITMQMLVGKPIFIYFLDDSEVKHEIGRFVVTDRYMNLRTIDIIDEYPILVNWLVEFVAGELAKKFPRSLKSIRAIMNEREERMKCSKKKEVKITTSYQDK